MVSCSGWSSRCSDFSSPFSSTRPSCGGNCSAWSVPSAIFASCPKIAENDYDYPCGRGGAGENVGVLRRVAPLREIHERFSSVLSHRLMWYPVTNLYNRSKFSLQIHKSTHWRISMLRHEWAHARKRKSRVFPRGFTSHRGRFSRGFTHSNLSCWKTSEKDLTLGGHTLARSIILKQNLIIRHNGNLVKLNDQVGKKGELGNYMVYVTPWNNYFWWQSQP